MIQLGLSQLTRRPEVRESFTDLVVSRLVAASAGVGDGGALAAIETASRWWGLGLASATVKPSTLALAALSPSKLDTIGRALCRSGESLHVIAVRNGRLTLTPTASWTVHGTDDPSTWLYRVTLSGPSTSRTITLPGESVLHIRYAPHPSRPWAGRSPVRLAIDTARVAGLLENATGGELNFTQQQLLTPRRGAGDYDVADSLTPPTIQKIVSAFSEHVSTGAFVLPADVVPQRLALSRRILSPCFVIVLKTPCLPCMAYRPRWSSQAAPGRQCVKVTDKSFTRYLNLSARSWVKNFA